MHASISNQVVFPELDTHKSLFETNHALNTASYFRARSAGQPQELSEAVSSPASLMARLMEKACSLLGTAALSLQKNDAESFQNATLHASQIILSLRCLLDTRSNKHLSADMFLTYTMIATSLRKAREEKDLEAIVTINRALDELRTAWHSVA